MGLSERVKIVLVRPARAGNVGAACRAMKNMGLRQLVQVEPPDGLDARQVRGLAWGAWDVLDGAQTATSLEQAVADAHLVVATSSRWEPGAWGPRELARQAQERAPDRVAIVFGPEASGLSDREAALCHARVVIPSDAAQPSLNLAQAVLLLAWELYAATGPEEAAAVGDPGQRATAGELETALDELKVGLLGIGYLDPQNPERMLAKLRRLLARARPSKREVTLLRGVARQVAWAARTVAQRRETS